MAIYANNVAAQLIGLGRDPEALVEIAAARKSASVDSGVRVSLWANEAAAHHEMGSYAEADEAIRKAVSLLDPTSPVELFNMAHTMATLGRVAEARDFLARHLAIVHQVARGDGPALDFIHGFSREDLRIVEDYPVLARALARANERNETAAPAEPTAEEIAKATEKARRPDGSINAIALARALAAPMNGAVRSDDRAFRFAGRERSRSDD